MQTGFDPSSGSQDDLMKRLMAMLGDTGFGGLEALLARLFGRRGQGGVPPIGASISKGGGTGGGSGTGGGGASGGGGGAGIPGPDPIYTET